MAKTWIEKFLNGDAAKVCVMDRPRLGFPVGAKMLIPTPADVLEVVNQIPSGTVTTPVELRKTLADKAGADVTCPLVTGIFLRIIAEIALEELEAGKTDVTPFWRVIDPKSPLAKKLPCGPEFLTQRRTEEQG